MNKQETALIMATLQLTYPHYYKDKTKDEIRAAVNLYAKLFADEPFSVVERAVEALIKTRTSTFPPVPGEINEMIQKIEKPEELTEMEAWALVGKAIRNSAYNSGKEFEALPPIVQKIVGSPHQLYEWSQMDSVTINSVVASNFQRSYKARAKNEREYEALPSSVKGYMAQLVGKMEIKQLEEKTESVE